MPADRHGARSSGLIDQLPSSSRTPVDSRASAGTPRITTSTILSGSRASAGPAEPARRQPAGNGTGPGPRLAAGGRGLGGGRNAGLDRWADAAGRGRLHATLVGGNCGLSGVPRRARRGAGPRMPPRAGPRAASSGATRCPAQACPAAQGLRVEHRRSAGSGRSCRQARPAGLRSAAAAAANACGGTVSRPARTPSGGRPAPTPSSVQRQARLVGERLQLRPAR